MSNSGSPIHTPKRTHRFRAWPLLILGLFLATACRLGAADYAADWPQARTYGTPGPGKILIFIKGHVARAGRHYVEPGLTLAELRELAGDPQACRICGRLPEMVTFTPATNPDLKKSYFLGDSKAFGAVQVHDGDCAFFWHFQL